MKLIVAVAANGVIGGAGTIPWHNRTDLQRFSEITRGHTVLMGRATWDSLPAKFRPLPSRRNYVVSGQIKTPEERDGARWFPTVESAVRGHTWEKETAGAQDLFIIGGGTLYAHFLLREDPVELHVSRMHFDATGSVTFPPIPDCYRLYSSEPSDQHDYEIWRKNP